MKTLIINGSPRKNGDTAFLVSALKQRINGIIIEVSAYYDNINPCIDCRKCWQQKGCAIQDEMNKIYADDFDTVVIASPIYCSSFPGPLVSLASRFQAHYAAKHFLKNEIACNKKCAALILVGGGDGKPTHAINLARWIFKNINAELNDENILFSLNTNHLPAKDDANALQQINDMPFLRQTSFHS